LRGASGLDLLRAAVASLRAETARRPPGTELDSELCELKRLIEPLRSVFSTQLRDFDRSAGYTGSGALSSAGWLRSECRPAAGRPDRPRYKGWVGRSQWLS
jgi:hypothetical protein